jgi:hypothetical protein
VRVFDWLRDLLRRPGQAPLSAIRQTGRDSYTVALDSRTFWINAEMLQGDPDVVIYQSTVRDITTGMPFHEAPLADPRGRRRAVRELARYFRSSGARYSIG